MSSEPPEWPEHRQVTSAGPTPDEIASLLRSSICWINAGLRRIRPG
jgi:hypothetical protein